MYLKLSVLRLEIVEAIGIKNKEDIELLMSRNEEISAKLEEISSKCARLEEKHVELNEKIINLEEKI